MEAASNQVFCQAIEQNVILPFVNEAAPVFWTNETVVSNPTLTLHRSVLTVPNVANCVCQAAFNYKGVRPEIEVRQSLINDRIYILRTISGVPMYAYQGLLQYKGIYDDYKGFALHLYEQNPDWRESLTFPYPYSYISAYTKNGEKLNELFDEAINKGIIKVVNGYGYLEKSSSTEILEKLWKEENKTEEIKCSLINELYKLLKVEKEIVYIQSKGNRENNEILRDNFLRFYGIQELVREELRKQEILHEVMQYVQSLGWSI